MQICKKCQQEKPFTDFPPEKRVKTGRRIICKRCDADAKKLKDDQKRKENSVEYYSKKREYHREYNREYKRRERLEKSMYYSAKARSKKHNIPFEISISDIIIPEKCPILQVKMYSRSEYAPSLDQIIPGIGYTKNNIMVISKKANLMKSNASMHELKVFAENIVKLYNL
jgi:isopropylmalate/homocitrate/citramalate synthase